MTTLDRRSLLVAAASLPALSVLTRQAVGAEAEVPPQVAAAVEGYGALPGDASCLVQVEGPDRQWRSGHAPSQRLFVGSAVKTFILAQFLRDVEAGRLSEDQPCRIDDSVRSPGSSVFIDLEGTTPARSVLEAMITHSDNTATDIALAATGPDRVRALIAEAGLTQTLIPDSTRRLFSYLSGADYGVDLGWAGMQRLLEDDLPGTKRPAMNDRETMISTAEEMVQWYSQALRGAFFSSPATLVEFKRIQAMADAIPKVVPPDIAAYGKGGSIEWDDFHCLCFAGQMVVRGTPATFCFTINWTGGEETINPTFTSYMTAVTAILKETTGSLA